MNRRLVNQIYILFFGGGDVVIIVFLGRVNWRGGRDRHLVVLVPAPLNMQINDNNNNNFLKKIWKEGMGEGLNSNRCFELRGTTHIFRKLPFRIKKINCSLLLK